MPDPAWRIVTPQTVEQAQRHAAGAVQAFAGDPARVKRICELVGPGAYRLAMAGDEYLGGTGVLDMGQFFAGRRVSTWGITTVAVLPQARGRGVAHGLMTGVLREARAGGVALSTLYPASVALYRKSGYELAGHYRRWMTPLRTEAVSKAPGRLVPFDTQQIDQAAQLYRRRAQQANGNLDRHDLILRHWKLAPEEEPVYRYFLEIDGRREGYLVLNRNRDADRALVVRDIVTLTPQAVRLAWSAAQAHRSVCERVVWFGSPLDMYALDGGLFPPQVVHQEPWMLRIVHVHEALRQRGYRRLHAELHLDIADETLPKNAGRCILTLRDGTPTVQGGGSGTIKLHVGALASLYSGYMSAEELARAGKIEAPADALAAATLAFAATEPWVADHF